MKLLPTLVCAAILALVLPACSSTKHDGGSCCSASSGAGKGSCDASVNKKHKR